MPRPCRNAAQVRSAPIVTIMSVLVGVIAPSLALAAGTGALPVDEPTPADALNRSLDAALLQLHRSGPTWLPRFDIDVGLDPDSRSDLGAGQPVLRAANGDPLSLRGRFLHDDADEHHLTPGMNGGFEDRRQHDLRRYRMGAAFRFSHVAVRAGVFDHGVDDGHRFGRAGGHRLDGYDVEVGAQVPGLPWAWLKANRFWQVAANGDDATTGDRLSLRLLPLAPLEIETGTLGGEQDRSWFAQLRVRFRLGDPG